MRSIVRAVADYPKLYPSFAAVLLRYGEMPFHLNVPMDSRLALAKVRNDVPNLHNALSAPLYPSAHMNHKSSRAHLRWGVVLAGGEGTRMRPLIHSWLGAHYPKQYCTFVGSRSMFQHTVDRARAIVPKEHVLSIIGPGHRKFLAGSVDDAALGPVLERRLDPCWESRALEALYSGMAPADFSKDILQHVSAQSMVLRMEGVDWCDWGNPQRVAESLSRLGRRPLFDFRHLASASAAMTCEGFA